NGGKNSLNRLIRCVCGKKIGPDPRNFNQRVSLGRNDLLIRTFLNASLTRDPESIDVFAGKKSAQIREILISESAWEEMTCLFAPSLMRP
ncbi:hypothetical protein AAHD86_26255, partial [Klebsiella michiganensis]